MTELLVLIVLVEVAQVAAFFFAMRDRSHERAQSAEERDRLLDRVMSRDLTEYKALAERPSVPPVPQVLDDEAEAQYMVRQYGDA